MSTPALQVSPSDSWQNLVSQTLAEVMSTIQREKPELLTDTFLDPIKFLPPTPLSHELMNAWLQSESHRSQIAKFCDKDLKDIVEDCVETCAVFICLKTKKPSLITRPVPHKTLIIIGLGRLYPANGMFNEVDLPSGGSAIVSGDKPQYFGSGGRGGVGIALRVKFSCHIE